ncbi:MAG: hypothetical protein V4580_07405 [Bacteroidota bacterium]
MRLLFSPVSSTGFQKTSDGRTYIYDNSRSGFLQRAEYVSYFSGEQVNGGIYKGELAFCSSILDSVVVFVCALLFMPLLFIHSLFKLDKAPYATLFKEILETINLVKICRKNNINTIFWFSIYEKDSNLGTLILQNYGIQINKIPSEVPLAIWNKIIIADKLCVCMGYQFDEIEFYKDSIFVNEFDLWGPERVLDNIGKYSVAVPVHKHTIGFYSTGAWIRKLENHADQGLDMVAMEESVKQTVKKFCIKNTAYKFIVFLHPRERSPKYLERTLKKYQDDFSGVDYEILDASLNSSNSFECVDLAVAFQSTIVYERLYYGFKTLLMPIGSKSFPVEKSTIENICAFNEETLFEKITTNSGLTNTEFFKKNRINHLAKFLYN